MTEHELSRCPVCGMTVAIGRPPRALADHLVEQAGASDGAHVMWLNRNVTKYRTGATELAGLLGTWASTRSTGQERVKR